jgi:hypothetical protein
MKSKGLMPQVLGIIEKLLMSRGTRCWIHDVKSSDAKVIDN